MQRAKVRSPRKACARLLLQLRRRAGVVVDGGVTLLGGSELRGRQAGLEGEHGARHLRAPRGRHAEPAAAGGAAHIEGWSELEEPLCPTWRPNA